MKKDYTKPQLVEHGKLVEQTQTGGTNAFDGGFAACS
jgi:hypothetical protein